MRKLTALLACLLALTFGIAACGDDDGDPAPGQETDTDEPMDDEMSDDTSDDMDDEMDEEMSDDEMSEDEMSED
ncbi:MAG: hypothetical protein ACLFRV_11810, partial [Acidimicrobiales bacterium]